MRVNIAGNLKHILQSAEIHFSSFDEARLRDLERRFSAGGKRNDVRQAIQSAFGGKIALAKKNVWKEIDSFLKKQYE